MPKKPYKCGNFFKFGLSCFYFLIAALRIAKEFFHVWATSEAQLLATWLLIKNPVLEHFFRVVLFHDTQSSNSQFMHKLSFFVYHERNDAKGNILERVKVPVPAHQVLPLTGCILEVSYSTPATRINKI